MFNGIKYETSLKELCNANEWLRNTQPRCHDNNKWWITDSWFRPPPQPENNYIVFIAHSKFACATAIIGAVSQHSYLLYSWKIRCLNEIVGYGVRVTNTIRTRHQPSCARSCLGSPTESEFTKMNSPCVEEVFNGGQNSKVKNRACDVCSSLVGRDDCYFGFEGEKNHNIECLCIQWLITTLTVSILQFSVRFNRKSKWLSWSAWRPIMRMCVRARECT